MSYIHSTAKHRRSGSTMQKQKQISARACFQEARTVLIGYPKQDAFQTNEEIAAYLRGDKIACLLCGKFYRQLSPHIARIHDVPADEYKSRFGIPQCVGLVGEGKGDGARRYWTSEEARANLEKMRAANGRAPKLNPKPTVPATKAAMIDRIRNYGVGETNAAAKLTVEQVAEIRQSKDKTGDLCRRFNVSRTTIKGIRKGERWQSVGVSA
jgi:hypothetical protein